MDYRLRSDVGRAGPRGRCILAGLLNETARTRRVLAAIILLVVAVVFGAMMRQRPSQPAVVSDADAAIPSLPSLGPVSVGTTVAGFSVARIEGLGAEVRVQLTRDGGEGYLLGLGAPGPGRPTPLVPVPDLYVWYVSDGGVPPTELIVELVRVLRAGADKGDLYRQILAWEVQAGGPRVDAGPG